MSEGKRRFTKIIVIAIVAAMVLSLFSAIVFADDESVSVSAGDMEAGVSYSADVSWSVRDGSNTSGILSSTAVSMITGYFGTEIGIIPEDDGTYDLVIGFNGSGGYSSVITGIYYYADDDYDNDDGALLIEASAEDESATFTINVPSIESEITLSVVIGGSMSGMFDPGADIVMTVDTASITTVVSSDASQDSGEEENAEGEDTEDTEGSEDADGEDAEDTEGSEDAGSSSLSAGTYSIDAEISAYVSAMGGIEFGDELVQSVVLVVDEDGNYYVTVYFTSPEITIFGTISAQIFVSSESAPGYYDSAGTLYSAGYTISTDTVTDSGGNSVSYIDSITFELPDTTGEYGLYIYIDSTYMGTQFGLDEKYQAYLTLDFASAVLIADDTEVDTTAPESTDTEDTSEDTSDDEDEEEKEESEVPYGLSAGTYYPDASLSAYISAMGGIQFGSDLLDSVKVVVNDDGTYTITVYFTTASVSIYSLSVDTFIDASDSTPGYYDADGNLVYASYTLSTATAADADGNAINYVTSMTFTVDELQSSYYLYIYVNSSVMGVQFCDGSGSGSSNTPGVETPYAAILTIDWSSIGATVSTEGVATADSANTALWVAVAFISAACALGISGLKKKFN